METKQLEQVLIGEGFTSTVEQLQWDSVARDNIEEHIFNLAETAINDLTVDDIESAIDIELPTIQLYLKALQQIRAIQEANSRTINLIDVREDYTHPHQVWVWYENHSTVLGVNMLTEHHAENNPLCIEVGPKMLYLTVDDLGYLLLTLAEHQERPFEEPHQKGVELLRDYGLWVGHSLAGDSIKDLTPEHYIEEFMEAVHTPPRKQVKEFLQNFYSAELAEELIVSNGWIFDEEDEMTGAVTVVRED